MRITVSSLPSATTLGKIKIDCSSAYAGIEISASSNNLVASTKRGPHGPSIVCRVIACVIPNLLLQPVGGSFPHFLDDYNTNFVFKRAQAKRESARRSGR